MNIEQIRKEMKWSISGEDCEKDILIVIHDQLKYIQKCVDSIFENTSKFNLYLWNNGSDESTTAYLQSVVDSNKNCKLFNYPCNVGFILPNNIMIKECTSEWIFLVNSDVEVFRNWDSVLIGVLKNNPDVAQTGFSGGYFNKNGNVVSYGSGFDIDYICGYCFCINKQIYKKFGLFDDVNLEFAYCEDSDFSMRLKEAGKKIYACHSTELVRHHGNKTTFDVLKKENKLLECANKNQKYLLNKWAKFIK